MQLRTTLVRPEWTYEMRCTCQTFYGMTFRTDRIGLREALNWLRQTLPASASAQEAQMLNDQLMVCLTRTGTAFHFNYHRTMAAACHGSPVEEAVRVWVGPAADSGERIEMWGRTFIGFMDATHPERPVERGTALLQRNFRKPPSLDDLAHEVGCSRNALTRAFKVRYGVSCGEYVTRLRLRAFIDEIVRGATAEKAAVAVGYSRYHNLIAALRARTGLTPSVIRCLPREVVRAIVDGPLAVGGPPQPHSGYASMPRRTRRLL
jgi:AraC-like DNA-binding protein